MDRINVKEEVFELVEILGYVALFTELCVDKTTMPEGMHCYALRHGDDDSSPSSIEKDVAVNYFGAVLLTEELDLGEDNYLSIGDDDFGFMDDKMTAEEFINLFSGRETECKE